MNAPECALCGTPITESNDTEEHIIPNSIGGRRTVKGFICNGCNNKSGKDWDSELAKQLNPYSLLFGIRRQRGDVPSQIVATTGGNSLQLNVSGNMDLPKPEYEETVLGTGVHIRMKARSMQEARRMLSGVKRKYPQVDVDDLMRNAQEESFYSPDMLKFDLPFGGPAAGRSLVKSAYALAVSSGVHPKTCEKARNYLNNENGEPCFGYYYERDLLINRPDNEVFHCVGIRGDPKTKQLLGYAEFYGIQRTLICLSDDYNGEEVNCSYAINPVNGQELKLRVDLALSKEEVLAAYRYKKISEGSVEKALGKVLPIALTASFKKEQNRVVEQAVEYAFKNCGAKEGETMTAEHIQRVCTLIVERMKPFLLHQFRPSEP